MPQIGHGLVALGLAAATSRAPRAKPLTGAWYGAILFLAYAPDVLEWIAKLAGMRPPHSALASLPALAPLALGTVGVALWLGERRLITHLILLAALGSHTLLDALSGGIPLYWPFSDRVVGSNLLAVWDFPLHRMILKETYAYLPAAAGGIAVGLCIARSYALATTCFVLTGACAASAWLGWETITVATAVTVMATGWWRERSQILRRWWAQLLPAAPVLALGGAQLIAWHWKDNGVALAQQGRHVEAIGWFEAVARLHVIGLDGFGHFHAAESCVALGREADAYDYYVQSIRESPRGPDAIRGLMQLQLTAQDDRIRNPQSAAALARLLPSTARSAAEQRKLLRLRDEALAEAERQTHTEAP